MKFANPLTEARLVRRYKRFFLDAELDDGTVVTAHCPNTGSLLGCLKEGSPVLLEPSDNPKRKLRWTWRMVRVGRSWVGIDSALANRLVTDALGAGLIPQLADYERLVPEVAYGAEGRSRIDLLLSSGGQPPVAPAGARAKAKGRALYEGDARTYVEVKSTTMAQRVDGRTLGSFPDAVTARGLKHLHELMGVVDAGHRAAMVFAVQRSDCEAFVPADAIDPAYGEALREALSHGVEAYALGAQLGPKQIRLNKPLPIEL